MMDFQRTVTRQITRNIAGHNITLTAGVNYLATRPMASRKRQTFPVNIYDWQNDPLRQHPVVTIPDLRYHEANEFLNQFNNGLVSFDGRDW